MLSPVLLIKVEAYYSNNCITEDPCFSEHLIAELPRLDGFKWYPANFETLNLNPQSEVELEHTVLIFIQKPLCIIPAKYEIPLICSAGQFYSLGAHLSSCADSGVFAGAKQNIVIPFQSRTKTNQQKSQPHTRHCQILVGVRKISSQYLKQTQNLSLPPKQKTAFYSVP